MTNNMELYDQIHRQMMGDKEGYLYQGSLPEEILGYVQREVSLDSKILELGAGGGHLSHWLQARGYDVLATDISQVALDVAKSNYPDLKLCLIDAEDIAIKDESLDVVITLELIEHLPRLHEHFREVRRILKRDGMYIVKTPNKWLDKFFYWLLAKNAARETHISLCSPKTLRQILLTNGFSCTFLRQNKLSQTQMRKLRLLLPKIAAKLSAKLLNNLLLRVAPLPFRPSIIVIARKETLSPRSNKKAEELC